MKTRRLILATFWLICPPAAAAQGPDMPCVTPEASYLLAANSGALIRIAPESATDTGDQVIVFRPQLTTGWASQRILMRFDLKLDDKGARIRNTGAFCQEKR